MQTQSKEKRCNNYAANDYEKQLAILRKKVAEMQGAMETKMKRHYEQPGTSTKTGDAECKEFVALKTHVSKTLARIDVDEEQLAKAKAPAEGYVAQLATATAHLETSKKDSGDLVIKLTQRLNNLHAEVARND